jgi:hypothetical protein
MSTQLAKITPFQKLDTIANQALVVTNQARGGFEAAFYTAQTMNELRASISSEMIKEVFVPLQNSALGFRTDNAAGYPVEVVKDCIIEAALRGVRPVGNQFNIISGRCYITKEGYEYKLKNLQGLANLKTDYSVPKMLNGGAVVDCKATWTYQGKEDSKTAEIPIRVNNGMGVDAILGKAARKFLKRVWEQITGCNEPDGDVEDAEPIKPAKVTEVRSTPNFGTKEGQ